MRVILLWVLVSVRAAHADPVRVGVEGQIGGNNPYGLGVAAAVEPARYCVFSVGAGSENGKLHAGADGRLRLGNTFSIGLGVSMGDAHASDHPFGESPYSSTTWDRVWWLDLDLGVEHRWSSGLGARLYVGVSSAQAYRGYRCDNLRGEPDCPPGPVPPPAQPFIGLALGYAYSI